MLEFVQSGLYFVQNENNFINPLSQVGSGEPKSTDPTGSGSSSLLKRWSVFFECVMAADIVEKVYPPFRR